MILQALTAYYEALLASGKLSPPGWDGAFKVSYGLELADDGSLLDCIPFFEEQQRGKKTVQVPQSMRVPAHVGRSSGISANFLCDNCTYMLGADSKGNPQRAKGCFAACAALHHTLLDGVESPSAKAILAFFDSWQPDKAATHPALAPIWDKITANANLVFCCNLVPVCEDAEIAAAWQQHYDNADAKADTVRCLVTGKKAPLARLHPMIKNVPGAQPSGAALVSFNGSAFSSYAHEQGENAPVGSYAAFAYATALNTLLADTNRRQIIGDTVMVCWAEHGEAAYQDACMAAMFGMQQGLDERDIERMLHATAHGEAVDWDGITLNPGEHFYVLGLAPNSARLSVRFFLRDTFGTFMCNINKHYRNIEIIRPSYDKFEKLTLKWLLNETVNQNSRNKAASPQLAGDVLRAVLTGGHYPSNLLNGVQLRIRAEREVTRGRAAIIKGYYLRLAESSQSQIPEEVLTVELNEDSTYLPYVLGRLFAMLELVQSAANPNINATIKDSYFSSASATPASIFPRLINLSQKHLNKLPKGQEIYYNQKIASLMGRIHTPYPTRMTLPEQGAFQLGYYHQIQAHYTNKKENK